jgi:hypothetical protein
LEKMLEAEMARASVPTAVTLEVEDFETETVGAGI